MKPRNIIILGAILTACTGYVVIRHTDVFRPKKKDQAAGKVFPAELKELRRIEVAPRLGPAVCFVKEGDDWRMTAPMAARADTYKVDAIADKISSIKYERLVSGEGKDAEGDDVTGLDAPRWKVQFEDAEGNTGLMLVGWQVPGRAEPAGYVRAEGKTGVVAADFDRLLDKKPEEFRDTKMLDLATDDVVRLTVTRGGQVIDLSRDADGKWWLRSPVVAPAEADAVDKMLQAASDVHADEFVPGRPTDLAGYRLTPGTLALSAKMQLKDEIVKPAGEPDTMPASAPVTKPGKVYTLLLGGASGEKVYAQLAGQEGVFKVGKSLLTDLAAEVTALRDKKLTDVDAEAVKAVEIVGKGRFVKGASGDEWRMTKPYKGRADTPAVREFVKAVTGLKAKSFAPDPALLPIYGLDKPALSIRLTLAKGKTVAVMVGAKTDETGEMKFVKVEGVEAVGVLPAADVKPLLAEPHTLWNHTPYSLPEGGKIKRLDVKQDGKSVQLALDENDTWSMTKPVKAAADKDNVEAVVNQLKSLNAKSIVALGPKAHEEYAKGEDHITVRLGVESKSPTTQPARKIETTHTTVHVVKRDGKVRAWVAGQEITAVGEFAEDLHSKLSAELRDRTVIEFEPEAVEKIRIVDGKTVTELVRRQETWQYTGGKYIDIDGDKVKTFLKDVTEVRAEKFATYSSADAGKFKAAAGKRKIELFGREDVICRIALSDTGPKGSTARYATATGTQGVFVLSGPDVEKLAKTYKDFKKSEDEN